MGTNECSQPASKSSWDNQDFGDVNMVLKMAHFHKSSRPQWVNRELLSLSLGLFFTTLLVQVAFLIFFSILIFSPYFVMGGLFLQDVALFQSGN